MAPAKSLLKVILIYSALILALLILFMLSRLSLWHWGLMADWLLIIAIPILLLAGYYLRPRRAEKPDVPLSNYTDFGITPREFEVLQLIAAGKSNKEIGNALFVSETTVKSHVSNLLQKLNARRRTEAVQKAIEAKILAI